MALAGDHVQVLVGGYDLTGDSNRIRIRDQYSSHDVTAFGNEAHQFILGQRRMAIEHGGYMNVTAAASSHPILKGGELSGAVSVLLGENDTPIQKSPVFVLGAVQGQYQTSPEIEKTILFRAMFANENKAGGWGLVVEPPSTSIINTTTGTGFDSGSAQSSQGGLAVLHILTPTVNDTYSITLQGGTTNAFTTVTTQATFTLNGTLVGSECVASPTTVRRWLRFIATRTGGAGGETLRFAMSFVRY